MKKIGQWIGKKKLLIAIIAVIAISILYTNLFLYSMWDPYAKGDQLPIAIVNQDQEVMYHPQRLNIGQSLIDSLEKDQHLIFDVLNEEEADQALLRGDYFLEILIPKDFTMNATRMLDENPPQMLLSYKTNPGYNFIASKFADSIFNRIESGLSTQITTMYTHLLVDSVDQAGQGLLEASQGSSTLEAGSIKLIGGSQKLYEGLDQLNKGLVDYTSGIDQLSDKMLPIKEGAESLDQGMLALNQMIQSLSVETSDNGQSLNLKPSDIARLKASSQALSQGMTQMNNGLSQYEAGLNQVKASNPILLNGSRQLVEGADQMNQGIKGIHTGIDDLSQALDQGQVTLNSQIDKISEETIARIVTPIKSESIPITKVINNGHAMAPYMMGVGLWVACLSMLTVYPLKRQNQASIFSYWLKKAIALLIISIIWSLAMMLSAKAFLGFDPAQWWKTLLVASLASVTFMSIMTLVIECVGKTVGSYFILLLLILQLSCSTGTYPAQLSPDFVVNLMHYMPMYYVVSLFRLTIAGFGDIRLYSVYLFGFTLLLNGIILLIMRFKHKLKENNPLSDKDPIDEIDAFTLENEK